ncbi:MAG TPA: amidohydrolase family protein [Nitrososphaera sp.]|jgi:cytosine/adenosine deaminase-related metal-dependent hydrolase
MPLIINEISLLLGQELEYVERGHLVIKDGRIKRAGAGSYRGDSMDGRGFLAIPGFVNAHTHIADSIAKDIAAGRRLDERVHPVFGIKRKVLEKSRPDHLKYFIKSSAASMMKKGIVAFADFREGGAEGVRLLRNAVADLPIKCVALGRTSYYGGPDEKDLPAEAIREAREVLAMADGLGISGANENSDLALTRYRTLAGAKLLAIHAAESSETVAFSKNQTGRSEVERIMQFMKPDFMVHMTNATNEEISHAAENKIGIVVCPRANGVLGAGIPRVARMVRQGCVVAIGTDNVMLNSPDITREMDYIWKASRALEGEMIDAREILKMATVNGAKILRLNSGCIEAGRAADLIFIDKSHADLYPMHDPHASIVHRLSESSIRSVMIDGRFVGGTIN